MTNYYETLGAFKTDELGKIKTKYYEKCMEHHPDLGGDIEIMKLLTVAYAWIRKNHETCGADRYHIKYDISDELIDLAVSIITLDDTLDVSIAGAWIWVIGNTKPIRKKLKLKGFRWAPKKCAWYYAGCKCASRGRYTLQKIFDSYGRKVVTHTDKRETTVSAGLIG